MSARPRTVVLLALLASAATLAGCGDTEPLPGRAEPSSIQITQVTLVYGRPVKERENLLRSKEEARRLALSLIERIQAGERMESLLLRYTDDLDPVSREPTNSGTVTLARVTPALSSVKDVAFRLKVGELHPKPIDTGIAYLVVRRDL